MSPSAQIPIEAVISACLSVLPLVADTVTRRGFRIPCIARIVRGVVCAPVARVSSTRHVVRLEPLMPEQVDVRRMRIALGEALPRLGHARVRVETGHGAVPVSV